MMRRISLALFLWALPSAALAQNQESEAGDTSEVTLDAGPLRDRIAPVSGHLFLKARRFEISPSAILTARDAFFTKYILGGTLAYHITENWAVALRGGYSIPVVSGAAQICTTDTTGNTLRRVCRLPDFSELEGEAPGLLRFLGGVDVQWSPLYGKIALWSELFVHMDLYLVAGPALVNYGGPAAAVNAGSLARWTVGGNVGVGTRIFLNRWFTLRAELRDLIYVEQVRGGNSFRNQILFEFGVSFFLPTTFGS
ncbi:MAG: outer membrane beta-barrel domain-containing protein [Myxococcaceae bacterium]